ncbi:16S rRNA (guanine(527)-N(7))-methyltransferase RsmG [Legionella israelensis]|uniref:Ribosomal RNA small subunit methyltransferase G n=1 Tax=Legionella israelensis TaxID=454 RepID=A0A0W0W6N2_9GAMM|nr:glucose inhibited division protein B GidB [Legionella israelensis]QBR83170.1 16S rRNA (guanine(527)-N(7))-methyltransferase RsmG [Legionella israelensis]QBS09452.1 16S rRNA (guanine(527)-N(7))-methyltransferase RsmG [Legionella israelensis]SCX95646.1 16S rRNA (guanine527-N7)-methyltransferase [Legionella israelensis DSM 19235]STX60358.1 glucose inhibited division protein B GidB [Legionella israelensis]
MNETDLMLKLNKRLKPFGFEQYSDKLILYLYLLNKWNQAYNLTAVREIETMLDRHIMDSLAISPWLKGKRLIDVGTGAGLPGIPLAVTHPDRQFVLLDSNGKKIRFLQEVKRQLSLTNVQIEQNRAENYRPAQGFDTVISRAFSSLEQMIRWTRHLLAKQGIWLAMKGRYPENELRQLAYSYTVRCYTVEGIEAERCCVLIDS